MKVATLDNLRQFKALLMTYINQPNMENEWLQIVYPVGSIYMSMAETSPRILFGFGTWEQIKDTFLLTAGDTYNVGSTGGEAVHALTIDEMPAHTHAFKRHMLDRDDEGINTGESGYGVTNKTIDIYETTTDNTGGSQAHNNMPPYLTVYAWRRVE